MTLTRVLLLINIHEVSESHKDGKFGENLHIQRKSNHQRSWKRDKFPRCEQRQRRMRSNFNKLIDRSSFVGRFRFGCFEKTFKEFLLRSIKGQTLSIRPIEGNNVLFQALPAAEILRSVVP